MQRQSFQVNLNKLPAALMKQRGEQEERENEN